MREKRVRRYKRRFFPLPNSDEVNRHENAKHESKTYWESIAQQRSGESIALRKKIGRDALVPPLVLQMPQADEGVG